jgi:hypothetical protein
MTTLPASGRQWLLHQRAAYAFLAGQHDEARAAMTQLGADFTASLLPQGVDRQRFQEELSAQATPPTATDKPAEIPNDF